MYVCMYNIIYIYRIIHITIISESPGIAVRWDHITSAQDDDVAADHRVGGDLNFLPWRGVRKGCGMMWMAARLDG